GLLAIGRDLDPEHRGGRTQEFHSTIQVNPGHPVVVWKETAGDDNAILLPADDLEKALRDPERSPRSCRKIKQLDVSAVCPVGNRDSCNGVAVRRQLRSQLPRRLLVVVLPLGNLRSTSPRLWIPRDRVRVVSGMLGEKASSGVVPGARQAQESVNGAERHS